MALNIVIKLWNIISVHADRKKLGLTGTAVVAGYVTRRSYPANCPVCWQVICPGSETGMPCPDEQSETEARYLPVTVAI
jgi:hypothetical protein